MTTSSDLPSFADVHEIEQVLYRYATALDTMQLDLFDDCFIPDARLYMSVMGAHSPAEYKDMCATELAKLDATQHMIGNAAIAIDGDTARVRSYYQAQHARNDLAPDSLLLVGGWIDDEFVKVDGKWRIKVRRGRTVWFDGNPAVLGMPALPPAARP
jgi:3-phenylpropionate/cinnamic acid dioxygenase small subunit